MLSHHPLLDNEFHFLHLVYMKREVSESCISAEVHCPNIESDGEVVWVTKCIPQWTWKIQCCVTFTLWRVSFVSHCQLVGIVKVSLHQFYMSYRDRRVSAALLRAQVSIVSVLSYHLSQSSGIICLRAQVSFMSVLSCHLSQSSGIICLNTQVSFVSEFRYHFPPSLR